MWLEVWRGKSRRTIHGSEVKSVDVWEYRGRYYVALVAPSLPRLPGEWGHFVAAEAMDGYETADMATALASRIKSGIDSMRSYRPTAASIEEDWPDDLPAP